MKNKPWTMKEGVLIGGGILLTGLALQMSVGPVVWDAFRWPANGVVMGVFLMLIVLVFLLRKKVYGFQFIGTYKAAIPALIYAVVLTVIMGLTRQTNPSPTLLREGAVWFNHMLSFWPFVLMYVYIAVILGQIILRRISNLHFSLLGLKRDIPFLLNHLGLFLAMTTATLGNADVQRVKMITERGEPERRALTQQEQIKQMPFSVELREFIMETYDDGSPRRFASDIRIQRESGEDILAVVEVNKPVEVDGWKIYQYGYDTQMGAMSQISILELVSDPWLPLVYTGIYMMLAGAVCMFVFGREVKGKLKGS